MTEETKAKTVFVGDYAAELYRGNETMKELVIRSGGIKELPIEAPAPLIVNTTISGPFEFYTKRVKNAKLHDLNKINLTINRDKKVIVLVVDENYEGQGAEITGEMIDDTELKSFGINNKKMWTVRDLQNHIKMHRALFSSPEECMKLVTNLGNFSAKIETDIQKADDKRGNTIDSIATKLTTEIPLNFKINSRLFKGQASLQFPAEICILAMASGVQFWLESVELRELQMKETDRIFNEEIKKFENEIVVFEE